MTTLSRFEIHQPATVLEASQMLAHYGEEAGIYAGGTELLLAIKHSALNYRHLIDLKVVSGLNAIEIRNGNLEIGAPSTHRSIERSALVLQHQPVLAEMESHVANVRVRATGTLGGNLCFAEPHSDPATLLLALGGAVRLESAAGSREIPVSDLIGGAYASNLQPGEILTKITVPSAKPTHRAAYMKFQVHERPALGMGLWLDTPDDGRTIISARVAVGCVCPFPARSLNAEKLLTGSRKDVEKLLPEAAEAVADAADLVDDHEGSAEYKRHLIHVFLQRIFREALD
ncbi:MAG TPA: FAD binding domain-containing protein [Candidatus Acidoferrales bacterium]|jgi:carbon-monoxide dehydrogenase medium subunit|nr:FAD binding domain-containing protein [Candidatus Acidoferrales bacterium]